MKEIALKKKVLRTEMHRQRTALHTVFKKNYDAQVCKKLAALILEKECKVVHAYLPMGNEIDIKPLLASLLAKKIKVVTPKTLPKRQLQHLELLSLSELEAGVYGTSHPANSVEYLGSYDLIIVPGLAFDSKNYRLGYGGGYYDAFLAENPKAFTVRIAYPFQKITTVPKEAHDVCLDLLV